jgi:hypothetical protein
MRGNIACGRAGAFVRKGLIAAAWTLLFFAPLSVIPCGWSSIAVARAAPAAALVEDYVFKNCLRKQFPGIQRPDPHLAFDPDSGRNFAYEDGKWIDTKTLEAICPKEPRTQQVGMVIEPKISIGLGGSSGTSTYDSTGGQAPFNGDWSHSTGQVCGGATFYPGFVIGPARVGLDVNVCSGSNTFGSGDTTLFRIMRHGPGDVDLRSSTNVIIDVLLKGEMPLGDPQAVYDPQTQRWFLSAGIGPTFREMNLTLTSNQSFFGGGVPSVTDTTWQTGIGVSAGLSTFVCPNCIAGNPLKVGVEGRARFFPSQSISLRSPAFGFTETGSIGRTTDYSALITFGVPFVLSDIRLKRDILRVARLNDGISLYRYRYSWSDQLYVGVMAQEVAKVIPDAVMRGADGYLRVDYGLLGLQLMTWDEWAAPGGERSRTIH